MQPIDYRQIIREGYLKEFAQALSCSSDEVPTSLPPEIAAPFVGVKNLATFTVWKSTGRHGLVWVKRGRKAEIVTESLLQHLLSKATIPENPSAA